MSQISLHLKSGQAIEITYGLNVLAVLSNETDFQVAQTGDLLSNLYGLWEKELLVLQGLSGAVEDAGTFDYDGNFHRTMDGVRSFRTHKGDDPTETSSRAGQRLLAITEIFRNFSLYPANQRHLGQDPTFLGLMLDTIALKPRAPAAYYSSRSRADDEGSDIALVLELHKNLLLIFSSIGANIKLESPFAAGRIVRFILGFLCEDSGQEGLLGPYGFPALEMFVKMCVLYDNREILAWNSDLLGLEVWVTKLASFLHIALADFVFTPERLAILELVLMVMDTLSSFNDELRRSVAVHPGTLQNLFAIALAGQPAMAGYLSANLAWTFVRVKAAQVLRELARGEAAQLLLQSFETTILTFLIEQGPPPGNEERTAMEYLQAAFHGILFSLQVGPEVGPG